VCADACADSNHTPCDVFIRVSEVDTCACEDIKARWNGRHVRVQGHHAHVQRLHARVRSLHASVQAHHAGVKTATRASL
jgi:hypothetical protein